MPEIHYRRWDLDFYVPLREAAAFLSLSHREAKSPGQGEPTGRTARQKSRQHGAPEPGDQLDGVTIPYSWILR